MIYKKLYSKVSQDLFQWALSENNRIKGSKMVKMTEKYEKKYRKRHRFYCNERCKEVKLITLSHMIRRMRVK